jgi:hypothetical protein
MQKLQKPLYWTVIASEASHVFCCVLPTLFSVLSLLAGLGLASAMPIWVQELHETLHRWELPLIGFSGSVLALGWAVYLYSRKIDCHNTGCKHACNCGRKKDKANMILKFATILFIINVTVYGVFHQGMNIFVKPAHAEEAAIVDIPACVTWKIEEIKEQPVWNPPGKVRLWEAQGQSYYYIPARSGDITSQLMNAKCEPVCAPDGGFTGKGDGKCPAFVTGKQFKDRLLWEDERK